jgi:dephospho-CoA kinase
MMVIGLTGSIGMGKSTLAAMMTRQSVPTHEADAEVHDLLSPGGAGFLPVRTAFPYYSYPQIYKRIKGGYTINRAALAQVIFKNARAREKLEKVLHPLVREAQNKFMMRARKAGFKKICLDVPLLFETDAYQRVDTTIVVSAPYEIQRTRVLARPGMTEEKFHAILNRQMPDAEKCARADYIIRTGLGMAHTMQELKSVLRDITRKAKA